ncbi:hypothetical protein ACLG6S_12975 [Thermodesulfobacteriota bacterium B35]
MKILRRKTLLLGLLLGLSLMPAPPTAARASLRTYVKKYSSIEVSVQQIRRLRRYDHLIEYFSSFSFFQPRHKVNPDFIRALILAESDGNPGPAPERTPAA